MGQSTSWKPTFETRNMFCRLNSCCCYDLRTGASVLAVLGLLFAIGTTIAGVVYLALGIVSHGYGHSALGGSMLMGISCGILLIGILNLIFFSFLVHGTAKNHPGYVKAWLIFMYVFLGIDIFLFIITLIVGTFISSISLVPSFILKFSFISMVRSNHLSLTEEETIASSPKRLEFNNILAQINPKKENTPAYNMDQEEIRKKKCKNNGFGV